MRCNWQSVQAVQRHCQAATLRWVLATLNAHQRDRHAVPLVVGKPSSIGIDEFVQVLSQFYLALSHGNIQERIDHGIAHILFDNSGTDQRPVASETHPLTILSTCLGWAGKQNKKQFYRQRTGSFPYWEPSLVLVLFRQVWEPGASGITARWHVNQSAMHYIKLIIDWISTAVRLLLLNERR